MDGRVEPGHSDLRLYGVALLLLALPNTTALEHGRPRRCGVG
ncbi:MAG TPA: hypothetical protein VMS01_03920 [Stellaceae bacterium]|nr:hypothetical protein [Stellaceae bacterium]